MNKTASEMESKEPTNIQGSPVKQSTTSLASHLPTTDMLVKGVVTGLTVWTITRKGRQVMSALIRNPIVMLGVGFATGFFAHKYRREIMATASGALEQSKDFVLRQKENLHDLLAENQEEAEEAGGRK